MTMVLVHGGGLGKECWDPLLPFLDGEVLAVDLPGRGNRPADLSKVGIADFVAAVVDDLESRDLHDVVLVGHSLAGLTIPQVAARVPDRIRALVFLSCTVPRDGQSTYDTLDPEIQAISDQQPDEAGSGDALNTLDPELATAVFYNDVTDPRVLEWGLSILVPEAPATVTDPMVLDDDAPRHPAGVDPADRRRHRAPREAGPVHREPRWLRSARPRLGAHGDDQSAAGSRRPALDDLNVGGGGYVAASISSRSRLTSGPPRYWPNVPSLRTIRWQGTTSGTGLCEHALAAARTAAGRPVARAASV